MQVMCECNSLCTLRIDMTESDKKLCYSSAKPMVVISDNCTQGPEPGDIVVKKGNGYIIYEEA